MEWEQQIALQKQLPNSKYKERQVSNTKVDEVVAIMRNVAAKVLSNNDVPSAALA